MKMEVIFNFIFHDCNRFVYELACHILFHLILRTEIPYSYISYENLYLLIIEICPVYSDIEKNKIKFVIGYWRKRMEDRLGLHLAHN